jgi:PcfJ-like protein
MSKKFNIGFVKHKGQGQYISSCSCGNKEDIGSLTYRELDSLTVNIACNKCRNKNFINLTRKKRDVFPYIEVLDKSRKGFKVKRTNLSVFYDDNLNVLIKENMIQVFKYDLINGSCSLYKNGESVRIIPHYLEDTVGRFFRGVDDSEFIKQVSTAETEALFEFAWNKLSYKKNNTWGERKIHRGLFELINSKYLYMQVLASAGFPNIERFYEKNSYYYTPTINRNGTNPKDILGVPKFMLRYIRENANVGIFEIKQIRTALKKVDGNRFKELVEIVKDESTIRELCSALDNLVEIHDTYGYNNIKKLTLYLFREIRMNQGITSASTGAGLLRDYIRMATKLGMEFEKYPKSLKKEHDIMQMNYKVQEDTIKRKEFSDVVEEKDYKQFEYKRKKFSIITPKEMDDLVKEGSELSHCVASYVNDIVSKRCKIFFLRQTDNLDKPFATVETRGENVRQARGYANRKLTNEERAFLAEWAEKKELQLNYY